MKPGHILVATNLAGRGTDLESTKGVEAAGGIHVIQLARSPPTSSRVEVQAAGRTGRQGKKGSWEGKYMSPLKAAKLKSVDDSDAAPSNAVQTI